MSELPVMNMSGDEPPCLSKVNTAVSSNQVQELINTVFLLQKRVEHLEKLVINKPKVEKSIWGYSL